MSKTIYQTIIKEKLRILIATGLIAFTAVNLSAQDIPYKLYTPGQILRMANSARQMGDYYNAIDLLKYYISKKGDNIDALYQLADNYRNARDYEDAAVYYKKVIDADQDKYPWAMYYYADMLIHEEQYADALKMLEAAKKKRPERELNDLIRQRMESCKFAMQEDLTNQRIRISHPDTSVNQENTELSPVFLNKNQFVYSAIKSHKIEKYPLNEPELKLPVSKFYLAEKMGDTLWKEDGLWNFNDENMHVGNGAFSLSGNRFYFTKCERQWDNSIRCAIYFSDHGINGWTRPEPLDNNINLPGYTATQVAVGRESKRNREVIYFVSDRPQGRGGLDIWYTIYNEAENRYSKPANAGPKINTKGDEITPYYDKRSGTFYFSSDYLPGYGGFDVFQCQGELRSWTIPENLGPLINTGNDELYYTVNPYKRSEGMFVSNRKGSYSALHPTCCDDLYYYRKETIDKIIVKGKVLQEEMLADSVFAGSDVIKKLMTNMGSENIIIDSSMIKMLQRPKEGNLTTLKPLSNATVSVYLLDDQSNEEIFVYSDTTNAEGEYLQELEPLKNYKIVIKKDEYFNQNLTVSTRVKSLRDTIAIQNVAMKPVPRKPVKITVYYDINSEQLKDESKKIIDSTLLTILKESPELIVEISSFTDSIGQESYNKKLSQKRAEVVVKYLVEKGIDKNRLIAMGYGESNPVADNATEVGRSLNRRTEFKVVGSIDQFSKLNVSKLKVVSPDGTVKEEGDAGSDDAGNN